MLIVALAGIGAVGFDGLVRVQRANDQVYSDNYLTEEATSEVAVALSRVETLSARLATAPDASQASRLRAELEFVAVPRANQAISRLVALHRIDPPEELRTIARIPAQWKQFQAISQGTSATPAELSALGRLVAYVSGLQAVEASEAASAHGDADSVFRRSRLLLLLAAVIALVAAVAQWRVGLTFRRLVGQQAAEQHYRSAEGEYVDTLQVTENEDEAQDLLRRHLERSLPSARVVVLTRNNSADRLEPKTPLDALEGLRESLVGAKPRSCLAVRYGRGHSEGGADPPLMSCEVCGGLAGVSDCEPLLVGGEVIGAVLVNQPETPDEQDRRRIREAVRQAAPVLGNLRNLAIAELRASTDALTGLPNQRAIQDTMKRMVAQASRTISPLAALLIDLDHFKQINDMLGHEAGDEVLAAVGDVLTQSPARQRLRRSLRRRGIPDAAAVDRPPGRAPGRRGHRLAIAGFAIRTPTRRHRERRSRDHARRCRRLRCALPSRRPRALRGQAQRAQPGGVGGRLCDRRYLNELTRLGAEAVRLAHAEPALFPVTPVALDASDFPWSAGLPSERTEAT